MTLSVSGSVMTGGESESIPEGKLMEEGIVWRRSVWKEGEDSIVLGKEVGRWRREEEKVERARLSMKRLESKEGREGKGRKASSPQK